MSLPPGHPTASHPSAPLEDARLLRGLLDASSESICATDAEGRVVVANRAWERALGFSLAAAAALPPLALFAPESRARYRDAAARLADGLAVDDFEAVLMDAAGGRIPVSVSLTRQAGHAPGAPPVCCGILRDRRERAEDARARELRALIAAMQDVAFVLDREGTYVRILETAPGLLVRAPEALIGQRVGDVFAPEVAAGFLATIGAALDARAPVATEYVLPIDGQDTTFAGVASPIDADRVLWVARDVTAERAAIARLTESEARFRAALSGGRFAYAALRALRDDAGDPVDFVYDEVNAEYERLSGMDADDILGVPLGDLWPIMRTNGDLAAFVGVARTGVALEFERQPRDPRVSARWVAVQVVPLADGVALLVRDVSAQKDAEDELRLLQEVTHAVAGADELTVAGALALEAMCAAAGWDYGELWLVAPSPDASEPPRLVHGPVWHRKDDARLAAFAAASDGYVFEPGSGLPGRAWAQREAALVPDICAPGVECPRQAHATAARLTAALAVPVLADGDVVGVLTFHARDARRLRHGHVELLTAVAAQIGTVVRRKLAEDALAREQGFLTSVLDSLSEHVSVCTPEGRLALFNRATRDAHGLPEHAGLPPEEWSAHYGVYAADGSGLLPVDQLPHVRALTTQADVDGVEYVIRSAGRPPRTMVANARVLHGLAGEVLGAVTAARDMTEQKVAEAALRESEARYRALFARSTAVQWLVDLDAGTVVDANEAAARFYGYPLEALRGKPLREIEILPPAARRAHGARAARGQGGVVPHRTASGEMRMVEFHPTQVELGGRSFSHAVIHDVTERIRAETALRQSEARLSLIYESATDLMFLMAVERDPDGAIGGYRCESVNDAYLELTGLVRDQLIGRTLDEVLGVREAGLVRARYDEAVLSGEVQRYEDEARVPAGRLIVETTLTPVSDADGICTHLLGAARDVSARRQAEAALRESEARFRGVLEHVRAVAVTLDAAGRVTFANDALLTLTGWSREEAVGSDWFTRFVPGAETGRRLFDAMLTGGEGVGHDEHALRTRDGDQRLIAWDLTVLRDATGAMAGMAAIGRDVTEQRALEARLAALSEHDELTGLLNRRGFRRMAEHELRVGRRLGRRGAVLYLDMDGFKRVNDVHGHAEGDAALRTVAEVLRTGVREGDLTARLGGDEFVVYATGASTADEGEALAARLRELLARANATATAAGRPYCLRFSVGVALVETGEDLDAVLTRADAALYARKLARRAGASRPGDAASP